VQKVNEKLPMLKRNCRRAPCAEFLGYKSNCLMINFGETIPLKEKEGINTKLVTPL
jgi:hypothetical protein